MEDRTVRILLTDTKVTFTPRSKSGNRGFVRMNGKTISGLRIQTSTEQIFVPGGRNENVVYGA
jgi:hypothetical protein